MEKKCNIITIDGPTASGKSTVGQRLAQTLDCYYINSGLLFRALAYAYFRETISEWNISTKMDNDISQKSAQKDNESNVKTQFMTNFKKWFSSVDAQKVTRYEYTHEKGPHIMYNKHDVTAFLKSPLIDQASSIIATDSDVRLMNELYQKQLAQQHLQIVVDGRDAGTVIFPDAHYKFFITASIEIRAKRWQKDQEKKGNILSIEKCVAFITERDKRDSERAIAPLRPASNAIIIDTSIMTIDEVIQQCLFNIKR